MVKSYTNHIRIFTEGMCMRNAIFYSGNSHQVLEGLAEPSLELALAHVGTEECRPFHVISEPRTEYILHFILSGSGFYSTQGNTWPLRAGQMFLIYPGEPIVYGSDRINPWSYAWIGFKGIRAESMLKQCGFSKKNLVLPLDDPQEVLTCIQNIMDHKSLAASDMLCRESSMIHLFSLLAKAHEARIGNNGMEQSTSSDAVYVDLGCAHIKEMYMHNRYGVEDVAGHIGITRARLNRAFQKVLKMSVQQYLIDFRMHQASVLLLNTPLSIKEIAAQVGYNDQLVFSKAFKKKYEVSPKAYRSRQEEGPSTGHRQIDGPEKHGPTGSMSGR